MKTKKVDLKFCIKQTNRKSWETLTHQSRSQRCCWKERWNLSQLSAESSGPQKTPLYLKIETLFVFVGEKKKTTNEEEKWKSAKRKMCHVIYCSTVSCSNHSWVWTNDFYSLKHEKENPLKIKILPFPLLPELSSKAVTLASRLASTASRSARGWQVFMKHPTKINKLGWYNVFLSSGYDYMLL